MPPAAAAELSGLDKPACPQPGSWSLDVPGQGEERSQGFRAHRGRNSSRNGEQRCWLLLGAAGGSGQEQSQAQNLPVVLLQGPTSRECPRGSPDGTGAAALGVLLLPLHCHVSQEQQSVPGLCSALLPLLQRTVSICFGSALEAAPGSGSDETCLGKPLPGEGWGYPAQAALMHKQLEQLQPWLLSPGPLQASPNHSMSRTLLSLLPKVWISPALFPLQHIQASPQHSPGTTFHSSSAPLSPCPHGFLHEAQLSFPLPRDRITELPQGLGVLGLQQPPGPGNPGSAFPTRANKIHLMGI